MSMILCLRTTLDIDDELLRAAKVYAADRRTTLRAIVEQALRAFLAGPARERSDPPPIPVCRGRGVRPGVDLTDSAALEGTMDTEP